MLFSWWVHCFKRISTISKSKTRKTSPLLSFHRLQLEPLERRTAPATHTWTGAASNGSNLWSDPSNWLEGTSPTSAEPNVVLVFPGGAANAANINDVPNLTVQSITLSGNLTQNYVLGGTNPITLTGPLTDSSTSVGGTFPPNTILFGIILAMPQTFTVSSASGPGLQVSGVISGSGGVTKAGAGLLDFSGANTYAGTTIINAGTLLVGGTDFVPSSSAVTVNANGILSLNSFNDRIGSLAGNGQVLFQQASDVSSLPPTLFTNGDNTSTIFGGVLVGRGNLVKEGTGTLTLSGSNTIVGASTTTAGTLLVNGSLPTSVMVSAGATLGGSGTMGPITAAGTISPGNPSTAILQSGAATFNAGSSFAVTLSGSTPGSGYDQLNAAGPIDLTGNPTLNATAGFAAAIGNTFTIITSTGGIIGTLSGLANNALLTISGQLFEISYSPTSVVLTRISIATGMTLTSLANPTAFGQPVSFMATITPSNPSVGTPTGTVQFQVDGANFGNPATLSNGVAASSPTGNLPVGGHTLTAVYSGDINFSTSTATLTQMVNPASTTTVVALPSNAIVFGEAVAFPASVSGIYPTSVPPTGTIQYEIDGSNAGSPVSLSPGGGSTIFATTGLAVGVHSISGSYSGDANYAPSASVTLTFTVNAANTLTTISFSPNPSVFGVPVGFTAVVQAVLPSTGTPNGMVTFQDGMIILSAVSLDATGMARFTTAALTDGNHGIIAVYSGNSNFNTSTSTLSTQTVTTSPFEAFVTALYLKVLERSPDAAGFNFWVQQLQAGATRASVATAFEASPEHDGLEVADFYQTFLGRPADAAGRAFWVRALVNGLSEAEVVVAFVKSAEYTAAHPDNATFINGLYLDLLGRQQADPNGLAFWQSELQQGAETRTQVVLSFLSSTEALTQAIDFYYTNLLGRPADPASLQGYLAALQNGQFRPAEITTLFLASDEFLARAILIAGG
jgi:autotransporter-associated beta strand protein